MSRIKTVTHTSLLMSPLSSVVRSTTRYMVGSQQNLVNQGDNWHNFPQDPPVDCHAVAASKRTRASYSSFSGAKSILLSYSLYLVFHNNNCYYYLKSGLTGPSYFFSHFVVYFVVIIFHKF